MTSTTYERLRLIDDTVRHLKAREPYAAPHPAYSATEKRTLAETVRAELEAILLQDDATGYVYATAMTLLADVSDWLSSQEVEA